MNRNKYYFILEPLITPIDENGYDPDNRRPSRFELRRHSSIVSTTSSISSVSNYNKITSL